MKILLTICRQTLMGSYEHRVGLWSNLIFGDPAETLETIACQFERVVKSLPTASFLIGQ